MNTRLLFPIFLAFSFGCGDKSDDTGSNSDQVSIDCSLVSNVQRSWGGSTNVCGPSNGMIVFVEGIVAISSMSGPDDAADLEDCDMETIEGSIDEAEAAALLMNICEEFNECVYAEVELADGAYDFTTLGSHSITSDNVDLGSLISSAEVSCEAGLPSLAELDTIFDTVSNTASGGD